MLNEQGCGISVGEAVGGRVMADVVQRVGEALRQECLEIFGSTWSNDVAWRLAKKAISAMDFRFIDGSQWFSDEYVIKRMNGSRRDGLIAGLLVGFIVGAMTVLMIGH